MGIYDDLDTQTQPLLNLDIFASNAVIFGGHMSGKTTFLKTLLTRIHQNLQPGDAEETYVIDFGGNLGEYNKLPLVAACFDNSNEENIRRIFKTVENKLEANIKNLRSTQFYEAYHESSERKPLHITLVIDNINAFLSDDRYASYQEILLKFCRDGLSKGLSIVFTASDTSNGLGKYLSSFGSKFAFDLPAEVYIDVFGMKINKPIKTPGRGVSIIDGKPREFQAFLPFENEKAELGEFIESLSDISYKAAKLQGFGEELTAENFSEYSADGISIEEAEAKKDVIAVGLDYYEHLPILVDLKDMHSIGIYGKKKFGKTNLLKILISSIKAKHPVPTRRRSATPFYTNCSEKPDDSANADVYSCPSNSSPKRRKVDKESNAPTVIFVSDENTFSRDESVSRPSNPLPTRRKFESEEEENISFAGKANETYFSETNGRAASNPSPTRRSVKTEDTSAVDTSVDRRMSNYISSIKK